MRTSIALVMLGLQACSLALVTQAPSQLPDRGGIRCTDASPWPTIDLVAGAGTAVAGAFVTSAALTSLKNDSAAPGAWFVAVDVVAVIAAGFLAVSAGLFTSALRGHQRQGRCNDAKSELRARGIDPELEPAPPTYPQQQLDHATQLAHEGEQAAERGDCAVVVAIAGDLRAMNEPVVIGEYLHDVGVAACMP